MPRKQRKVNNDEQKKAEEIHPDFSSDTVTDSPDQIPDYVVKKEVSDNNNNLTDNDSSNISDNLAQVSDNLDEGEQEIENPINDDGDHLDSNINYGDDEP